MNLVGYLFLVTRLTNKIQVISSLSPKPFPIKKRNRKKLQCLSVYSPNMQGIGTQENVDACFKRTLFN